MSAKLPDGSSAGASGRGAAPIRVDFMPFNRENQYWQQLATHLEEHGVRVGEWRMLKGLIGPILRREPKHDVLHMNWMPCFQFTGPGIRGLPFFLLRMAILRLLGHRVVWTAHDLAHPETVWRWADRWHTILVTPFISRIIVHSEGAKEIICREFKIWRRSKVVVIPHGNYIGSYPNAIARAAAREVLGLNPRATVFLLLGHLRRYKGVDDLISAFQKLPFPNCQLVIAGKPHDAATIPSLEGLIRDRDRIKLFPGFIPDDQVQVYLNAADAMVIPYRQGLTSGALVLAMSFGRACVAAAIGCIPDMVDEQGSFLYDPDQPDGLRQALARAVEARDRLDAMGEYNLQRVRHWTWERAARDTAEVYASVLGRNR